MFAHKVNSDRLVDGRVVFICGLSIGLAVAAAFVAEVLKRLIWFVTGLAFYGKASFEPSSPAENTLGLWVIAVPVIGGVIVGFMARYGSRAIRGHGSPEAMEQILTNESRIPARMTFLKPISAAIAIGTGGPFGAEGPIIATGGALGSLLGQVISTSALERKTLLAAGAAAGMAATFGSPVSAVLLAVELLLFEFRPRSMIPVALASATAAAVRVVFEGTAPVFAMPDLVTPSGAAVAAYIVIGAVVGLIAVGLTKAVYAVEDGFEHLPVHWMWWPAVGGLVVGAIGFVAPRTLGVGYSNIGDVLSQRLPLAAVATLCTLKFISWCIALGSGTSGGTLAPLFTIGSGVGTLLGALLAAVLPSAGVDLRVAALVGMAAIFAGASRALLASVIFAFETTLQPLGLLPLLGGCSAAFLVSCLLMRNSIMTEKIARRGITVPGEYMADFLAQIAVTEAASPTVVSLRTDQLLGEVQAWLAKRTPGSEHQGFPVLSPEGTLVGVMTRRDLLDPARSVEAALGTFLSRAPIVVHPTSSLRDAEDEMVRNDVGRLPVVAPAEPGKVVGFITRSDLLRLHRRRLSEMERD
jgi:CIC family chloride channel protein